ncbi:DeoR/GlpR family DNA-binding transcription regulator [Actinomycetaceae bacterium L2_0104]
MNIDERQRDIVEFVREHKTAKVATLSKQFRVSAETIRKDLVELDDMGLLLRVHGGARLRQTDRESAYSLRQSVHMEAKEAIAHAAVALVEDGSTIYLDYGTTTKCVVEALVAEQRRVTVVTNSLPIADLVASSETMEGVVLGGILRRNEGALYGPIAEKTLEALHFDVGIFGCGGIEAGAEITNHFPLEVALSQKAMGRSARVVVVADSSKLDAIAVHRLARFADVDVVITSDEPDPELRLAIDEAGVSLEIVDPKPGL